MVYDYSIVYALCIELQAIEKVRDGTSANLRRAVSLTIASIIV